MTTELITEAEIATAQSLARAFHQSGFFKNVQSEAQAFVKIMLGREFGLGPAESMRSVYVVNGKPAFEAAWIAGRIKSSGKYDYKILEHDDERCVLRFFQDGKPITGIMGPNNKPIPDVSFTMADARKADILKNPNYQKYPRNMLFARALTNGARFHTPDIFNGPIYTPDELRAGEGPEHVDVGALPRIEEIRRPLVVEPARIEERVAATEEQIQADLERLGLRPKADAPADEPSGPNPWLHMLEGVEHDGITPPSAGKRICEVASESLKKIERSRYFTAADKEAVGKALSDPARREEALAVHQQMRNAELSFEDDNIPAFS
jgi:hypothetical protein